MLRDTQTSKRFGRRWLRVGSLPRCDPKQRVDDHSSHKTQLGRTCHLRIAFAITVRHRRGFGRLNGFSNMVRFRNKNDSPTAFLHSRMIAAILGVDDIRVCLSVVHVQVTTQCFGCTGMAEGHGDSTCHFVVVKPCSRGPKWNHCSFKLL